MTENYWVRTNPRTTTTQWGRALRAISVYRVTTTYLTVALAVLMFLVIG